MQVDRAATLGAVVAMVAVGLPLVPEGLPQGHDLLWELLRIQEFDQAGVVWPHWAPNLARGHGYPVFHFFPPVWLRLVDTLRLGMSLFAAVKVALMVLAAVSYDGAWRLARHHVGPKLAALLAAAWVLLPYRAFDLLERNAFSELTALSLLPWVVGGVSAVARSERPAWPAAGLAVASALLAMSHNLSVVLALPVVAGWALTQRHRAWSVGAAAVGAALSALYWMPALLDTALVQMPWAEQGPDLTAGLLGAEQLLQPLWIGQLCWVGGVLLLLAGGRGPAWARAAVAVVLLGAVALVLAPAAPLWASLEGLSPLGFPTRLLGPASLLGLLAVLRLGPEEPSSSLARIGALGIVAGCLLAASSPPDSRMVADDPRLQPEAYRRAWVTTTMIDEYLPLGMEGRPVQVSPGCGVQLPDLEVALSRVGEGCAGTVVNPGSTPAVLTLPVLSFPAWELTVDGQPVTPRTDPKWWQQVELPPGRHDVALRWAGTPWQHRGLLGSKVGVVAWVLLLGLALKQRR